MQNHKQNKEGHSSIVPKWKLLEKLTDRSGYRAAVFGGKTIKEKYTGWFKDNLKHGKGFQTYEDGTFYEGDWAHNKRNGHGYLSFICPSTKKFLRIYTGKWKDDHPHLEGMKSFPDGGFYQGEFKKGKRNGWGCMYYPNGSIYTGHWVEDVRHGVGRFFEKADGNYYEGSYQNDQKCGLGRYYHVTTGQVQEGVWFDDLPVVSEMRDYNEDDNHHKKTEFPIPELTILKDPQKVYLAGAYQVLESIGKESEEVHNNEKRVKDKRKSHQRSMHKMCVSGE